MPDLTQKEMDAIHARYAVDCHERAKYHGKTMDYIASQSKRALDEFALKIKNPAYKPADLWGELTKYRQKDTSGVTGPSIRKALRKFLEKEQNHLCCYCQRPLVNIAHAKPIEHILPRVDFVQYTFEFWNLAVSCFDCNQIKLDAVWADDDKKDQAAYPGSGTFNEMYHPRFHRFSEHVRFIRVQTNDHLISLYVGISEQGRHLCLNLLKDLSAREIVLNSNPQFKNALEVINAYAAANEGNLPPAIEDLQKTFARSTAALIKGHSH